MAIPYDKYYQNAMSRYAPQREADLAQTSAGLADKGLLASTGGQGALGDVRARYQAAAAQEANQNAQWQMAYDEQKRQAARQTALQWWDAINSLALSKKNAGYKDKALYWANTPSWYKSYQTTGGLKYGDGKGEVMQPMHMMPDGEMMHGEHHPIGDGKGKAKQPSWVNYDAHQEDLGSSLAERQFNAQQDMARQQLALEERRLNESIRQSRRAAEEDKSDPWYEMMTYVNSTTQADKDPDTPGIQRAILPSEVLNTAEGTWGFDVLDMAKSGDEKAVAVIKLLYPETWQQRLGASGGSTAAPKGVASPASVDPMASRADWMRRISPAIGGLGIGFNRFAPEWMKDAFGGIGGGLLSDPRVNEGLTRGGVNQSGFGSLWDAYWNGNR